MLNSERLWTASRQVCGTPLDEGGISLLGEHDVSYPAANAEVHERRNQKRHPVYKKPELRL
ncbi:MAG: hypothetical protein H6669_20025 [Ardenticatenaceae bacterium]|nr:hypothetical protein [Ardenticatenaceae bacterium]